MSAIDRHTNYPARGAAAVTPADGSDLPITSRFLYIGGTGNIKLTMDDETIVTLNSVPVGMYAIQARRVWATGTTATNIVALW